MLTLESKPARKRPRLSALAQRPDGSAPSTATRVSTATRALENEDTLGLVARTPPPPAASGRTVTIEYCVPGNYEPRARELARALEFETGCQVRLEPSRDGSFEVSVDGRRVFSKRASWRFPDADEILYHVLNG